MNRIGWERAGCGVGALVLLASLAGFGAADLLAERPPRRWVLARTSRASGPVPMGFDRSVPPLRPWRAPAAQPRGPGWIYDAFTPPEVTCDARRGEFTAVPPRTPLETFDPEFELVAVRREPFRVQLRGVVGDPGRCQGVFENVSTGEIMLAGPGQIVPALGLVVTELRIARPDDGALTGPPVAVAAVHDGLTGQTAALREGEECFAGTMSAVLAMTADDDARMLELREGEEFRSSDLSYRVERLLLNPPRVVLLQQSDSPAEITRLTLAPREAAVTATP